MGEKLEKGVANNIHSQIPIKKEFSKLIKEYTEIVKKMYNLSKSKKTTSNIIRENYIIFSEKYNEVFTPSSKLIHQLAFDRYVEFIGYYKINDKRKSIDSSNYKIQDFALQNEFSDNLWFGETKNEIQITFNNLVNQLNILKSIESNINKILFDIEYFITKDLLSNELETCKVLLKINIRAAGSLAGVILEKSLSDILQKHNVKNINKNSTINQLNDLLKQNHLIDDNMHKKITYLSGIRNCCTHQKEKEPTKEEVDELINETDSIFFKIDK